MTDTKKRLFQEYYSLSGLPIDICRLLISPIFPLFETRTTEYDKKWRQPIRRGIIFSKAKNKRTHGKSKPKEYTHHLKEEWTQQEQEKKKKLEERTRQYGRPDISRPLHNPENNGYSSSQLTNITSLATKRSHKPKHLAKHLPHISVNIIPLQIGKESKKQKITILMMMDHETTIISAQLYERLGPKSISTEVNFFITTLKENKLPRTKIHFVNNGNARRRRSINTTILLLKKDFPEMKIKMDEKYNFKNKYQLDLDIEENDFKIELNKMIYRYNIGADWKRPGPYLLLRSKMKEERLTTTKNTVIPLIEKITKLRK